MSSVQSDLGQRGDHERVAPDELALREALLRHLMGVPLAGRVSGNRHSLPVSGAAPAAFFMLPCFYSLPLTRMPSRRKAINWSNSANFASSAVRSASHVHAATCSRSAARF